MKNKEIKMIKKKSSNFIRLGRGPGYSKFWNPYPLASWEFYRSSNPHSLGPWRSGFQGYT